MRSLLNMKLEDSTVIGNEQYIDTSTWVLSESRFNFESLRIKLGYNNDGFTIFEIPVTENNYFCITWPTGAGSDLYRVFVFVEWISDYSFITRTGKDLWVTSFSGASFSNNTIASNLTTSPNDFRCRPFVSIEGLTRKNKNVITLDLNTWTVVNTNTITIKGGRLIQRGVGGWHENAYKAFIVPETGTYTVSYDYKIINATCGSHGTYGYGLWFTPNSPAVDDTAQYNFYVNAANRTGTVILAKGETGTNKTGHVEYNITCNAGTTYYLWHTGAALNDGTTYNIDLINIKLTKV
jgi:hypothetical protein